MFIFLFVPGIVSPFTVGAQDETVTVNRVSDGLAQGQLGSPERPGVLQAACTVDFFEHADGGTISEWGPHRNGLAEFVGIKDRQSVNVSVHGNITATDSGTEQLCWNTNKLAERDSGSCNVPLTAGDTLPNNNADSVTAKRVAHLAGEDVTIVVEMW